MPSPLRPTPARAHLVASGVFITAQFLREDTHCCVHHIHFRHSIMLSVESAKEIAQLYLKAEYGIQYASFFRKAGAAPYTFYAVFETSWH
jgi:hypothetical protein